MTAPRITWIRAGDRYPDLKHDLDHFIALDGETRDRRREVGRDRARITAGSGR